MDDFERKRIMLKAKIELGPDYAYKIRNGGLGMTLVINTETKERAQALRKKIGQGDFEGLRTIVTYYNVRERKDE